jgi:hypothetical protein
MIDIIAMYHSQHHEVEFGFTHKVNLSHTPCPKSKVLSSIIIKPPKSASRHPHPSWPRPVLLKTQAFILEDPTAQPEPPSPGNEIFLKVGGG